MRSDVIRIVGNNLGGGARVHCYQLNRFLAQKAIRTTTFIPAPRFADPLTRSDMVPFDYRHTLSLRGIMRTAYSRRDSIRYIHSHLRNANMIGAMVSSVTRIPHVITVHTPMPDGFGYREAIYARLLRRVLMDARLVLFISAFLRDHFLRQLRLKFDPSRHIVVHNGSDIEPMPVDQRPSDASLNCCIVGELTERKGIAQLGDLLHFIRERPTTKPVRLHIYGDGPLRPMVTAWAKEWPELRYCGYQADVSRLYEGMHVNLSLARNEGFGRVLTEAMARGIPTVALESGAFPEIIDSGVTGLLSHNVADLAGSLQRLSDSPQLLQHLSVNARRRFEEAFSAEAFAGKVYSAVEIALGDKRLGDSTRGYGY